MDRFYSVKQTAEALGKSRPTIYRMIRDGELKLRRFAGKSAIAIADVERLQRRYCSGPDGCGVEITEVDINEAQACTNCGKEIR